jgi:hypothetical protein
VKKNLFKLNYVMVVIIFLLCRAVSAQTLTIGTDSGQAGDSVSVPVILTDSEDNKAVLVRVDYDSTRLENPSVIAGGILSASHVIEFRSQEDSI